MNILKNMEAIFVIAAVLAISAALASNRTPSAWMHRHAAVAVAREANVPVVVVSAKRLSAAQKAALT